MPSGRTNNYPESGRGLGHVTPRIFGIRLNISLKLLELETSNLIHGFVWAMPSRRINNFPESRRGLGHVILQFLAVWSAILATAWLLVPRGLLFLACPVDGDIILENSRLLICLKC